VADDVRIVIEADAHKVVVESRKAQRAIKDLGDTARKAAADAKMYQDSSGRWREENGKFVTSARKAELGLDNLSKSGSNWNRVQDAGAAAGRRQVQTLHEIGSAARRTTLALGVLAGAGLTHLIKTGADFEQEMSRVKATLDATGGQMKTLTALAQKMGADTKFSASEAASAMYELASAGFKADEMAGALKGTLALAASSNMDLASASEITANALRGFNLHSSKSTHVADVLAKAVASSSLKLTDMQDSLKYVGGVATTTGQSFEQLTAALSIMADAGIKGEQGGTSLRGGLLRLVKPTKQVEEGLSTLGIKTKDLQGPNGLKPLSEIVALLTARSDKLSTASRNTALAQVFGIEAFSGMSKVFEAGAPKLERLTRGYEKSDGAASKMSKTMQDNVKGAFEQLTGSIETVETTLFSKFQKPLKEALLDATKEVNTKGKEVEQFFDRVFELPEFKSADVGGKLRIILEEFDKTGLPHKMRDLIVEGFAKGLDAALPVVIEGAGHLAVAGAKAFGKAFIESDPLSRVLMTGYLLHKTGALAAFRAYGKGAGGQMAAGAAAGAASGAAAGGWKNSAARMGKLYGIAGAVAAAAAFGPELIKSTKTKVTDFGLPKFSGYENFARGIHLPRLITPKNDLGNDTDKLKEFGNTVDDTVAKLKKAGDSRGLTALAEQTRALAKEFPESGAALNAFAEVIDRTAGSARDQFAKTRGSAGKDLKGIAQDVADTTFDIKQKFGPDTARAKEALARNFMLAAAAVRASMKDGKISTKEGIAYIEELFVSALVDTYGFTRKEAINRAHGKEFSGKSSPGGTTHTNAAKGLIQVGRAGAKAHDNVPAVLNGQPAMIADGEQVAVFNADQQADMNRELAHRGGLSGFFKGNHKPHYMAGGGLLPRYAGGGLVSGDTDYGPVMARALNALAKAAGREIFVQSGGRTMAEQAALVHQKGLYGPGNPTGAAAPSPNAPHIKGIAADITPGREAFGKLAARFGLGFPLPAEPWHIQLLGGGGGGAGVPSVAQLKRVMARGDLGVVSAISQRVLDITREGAQARLDSLAPTGGSEGGGVGGAISGAGASGDGAALMRQISKRYGWNFADWWAIDAKETSHGKNLSNPTSSARLRGQFLDMNYGKYGPGSDPSKHPSMGQQIEAMAAYIKDRYGNPTAALAFHMGHNWYAAGGIAAPKGKRKAGPKPKNTRSPTRGKKPASAKAKRFKPLKYRGKVLDAVPQLAQITAMDDQLERAQRHYDDMDRGFNLTDEEQLVTDAQGNEVRNEPDIARRVSEIDALIGQKTAAAKILEDQKAAAIVAAKAVAEAIKERQERIAEVTDAAKRNKRRIEDAQEDLRDEQRGKGYQGKISANDKRIDSLQDDLRAETSKKHGSRSLKLSLRNQIDELQDENKRLRKTKPKGGDAARVKRLTTRLDHLRDEREELVGTRSTAKDARIDGGMLGDATAGLAAYREAQGGSDGRQGLVELLGKTLPDSMTDIGFDVAELRKEREKWTGTVAPIVDLPTMSGSDNGLADLLQQQLDAEREKSRMLGQQLGVYSQFAPLVGMRMQGSFARGLDEVRETGLAVIHKGETIGADPQGPFGNSLAGVAPAPVQITLMVDGDVAPLMKRVRAEVDGRAVRVVSEQLGRRSRIIASAPGGR
jgi:TP901 family phage tail tape measure protein